MPRLSSLTALLAGLGLFLAPLPTADAFGPTPNVVQRTAEARLLGELSRFAALSDGTVGIAIRNLGDGQSIGINDDTMFPMASTFKIAVAGKIFSLADAGALGLDERLSRFGTPMPITALLDLMLTRSDNEATDVLIARAGGPLAVNDWVRSTGVRGQRIDSDTAQLLARAKVIGSSAGDETAMEAALSARQRDARDLPNIAFAIDPRDTSTPRAMNDLLAAIHHGRALKPGSSAALLAIMARCKTGKARLAGMLPPGTSIAHKTGTVNGLGNDAGIISVPDGRMFAISVFVMKDRRGHLIRDRIMAEVARAAYDYFLFAPESRTS